MLTLQVEQGTAEWVEARIGIPTASNFEKILTTDGKPSKQREKYLYQLAGERVAWVKERSFQNADMTRGIELEASVRSSYELITDQVVTQVGICYPNEDKKCSCSPDGLVGEDGGLEIKCPIISVHVGYLVKGNLLDDYFHQVQGGLYVTGRKWWDLMSFFPGIKPCIVRVERDEKFIKSLAIELEVFFKQLDEITERIR